MTAGRILVALDGSRLAEAAVAAARSLAEHFGARLLLVHVLEREPPSQVHGEPHLGAAADARGYLDALAAELGAAGVTVEAHVREPPVDDVAEALDAAVRDLDADLIVMCAHGRTNLRGRLLGSIAERTLRRGTAPILLQTVPGPEAPGFEIRQVLVPVDFGHDVDAAVAAARAFAGAYGAAVTLLAVPELAPGPELPLLPQTTALAYAFRRDDIRRRLGELADGLRADVADVRCVMLEERPADAILGVSGELSADLIVLVTDAHTGVSAWYDPSTTRRLVQRGGLTLLLLRQPA